MAVGTQDETPAYGLELSLEQTAFPINSVECNAARRGSTGVVWSNCVARSQQAANSRHVSDFKDLVIPGCCAGSRRLP